ncbi:hypothetical protein AAD001_08260 [Colwelliaceae bacterium 6471]
MHNRSTNVDDFEAMADIAGICFTHDEKTKTLIIDEIGLVDLSSFVCQIKKYAGEKGIAKISVRVREASAIYFFQHGFMVEASIMAYYGLQDAFYVVYYLDKSYREDIQSKPQDEILDKAFSRTKEESNQTTKKHAQIVVSPTKSKRVIDANKQVVFTGREHTNNRHDIKTKFFAQINNNIVATADANYSKEAHVVEFSNFIASLEVDISSIIKCLLSEMQSYYASLGAQTAFTIVSANSLAINTICVENGFEYGGRLTNESIINGSLASLNTWFKRISLE